jgi:hypothetical protein
VTIVCFVTVACNVPDALTNCYRANPLEESVQGYKEYKITERATNHCGKQRSPITFYLSDVPVLTTVSAGGVAGFGAAFDGAGGALPATALGDEG